MFPYLILFIFGLAAGSFLNVVSLRYQPGGRLITKDIITGRSYCLRCDKKLKWYELIPLISFLIQAGKCRSCGARLSLQYPIVELLSGLIFIAVFLRLNNFSAFGGSALGEQFSIFNFQFFNTAIWIIIFEVLLLLSIIDFRHYLIPDSLNLLLAVLGIVLVLINLDFLNRISLQSCNPAILQFCNSSFIGHYSLLFTFSSLSLSSPLLSLAFNRILAAAIGMIFFSAIIILTRGKAMGWGDVKLVAPLGLIFSWPDISLVIALSFIVGALVSIILMLKKRKTMKDVVPFGPFLAIGAALTFFAGFQIINAYFQLFYI